MIVKDISFDSDGRDKLLSGINKLADAVKSTLGAGGETVLIESEQHTGGLTITKDGVTVAKSITLMDPIENLAVTMMKEAAENTAITAGDGTTTAIVLTQSIINTALDYIAKSKPEDINKMEMIGAIRQMSDKIVKVLLKSAKKITTKGILNVATISSNNDDKLGSIIAEAYTKVGRGGVVTLEDSKNSDTYCDIIEGVKIHRGFTSKHFINDIRKEMCVLDKPYILVTDQEINSISAIDKALTPVLKKGRSVLIIGNVGENAIKTLAVNHMKGIINVCNIIPPQFGYKSHELCQDIAQATGAKFFSESMGDDLSLIEFDDLGEAKKAIITAETTVLTLTENAPLIEDHIKSLWELHDETKLNHEKAFIKERIATLTGGIGVVYVGANSDIELKEKRDRVDDAICATRAALENGILPGGGIALKNIANNYKTNGSTKSETLGQVILMKSLSQPFAIICRNAGIDPNEISKKFDANGIGVDVRTKEVGDMYKLGIIDPAKVTACAIENAVSVATTILSTNAIITNVRL
jgi:chaperonin GroEL